MRQLIGTSWKMNLTSTEAAEYFRTLVPLVADVTDRDLFILPPFTSIWVARRELDGSNVAWGGQDVHPESAGAHTGDVSAAMLADLGSTYAEVGHSERRHDHGERDGLSARKVAAATAAGLRVVLCVGESRPMATASAIAVVRRHLNKILNLSDPADLARVVVAYEPHWAIGSGAVAADPGHVSAVHLAVHDWLVERGSLDGRVIYGGSVNQENAEQLLGRPGVDGLFVGRAALDPRIFAAIAHSSTPSQVQRGPADSTGNRALVTGERR